MRFFLSLAFLFLTSCAGHREVATGKYPVKGVCRSCKAHMIKGVWYTPQLFYDYDEIAIASWYGPGFHGKTKANGQTFDQDCVSAAHKTLPLPTVVKVTNLENGKSLNLVVDDRGPYIDNRIIDLSIGAAKFLGVYERGTAKVRVQSIPAQSHAFSMHLASIGNKWGVVPGRTWEEIYNEDIASHHSEEAYESGSSEHHPVPGHAVSSSRKGHLDVVPLKLPHAPNIDDLVAKHASADTTAPTTPRTPTKHITSSKKAKPITPKPHYFIHLASFVKAENAYKLVKEIDGLAQATVQETVVPSGQTFYVVKCGPYPNKDTADMALTSLDVLGHNPQLIKE